MADGDLWVIDTSSIIWVRRDVVRDEQDRVYAELGEFVESGRLFFPVQVFRELNQHDRSARGRRDRPLEWAKEHRRRATQHGQDFDILAEVLSTVPDVLDPDKPGAEEADPYVLMLAKHLDGTGHRTTVITEERKDRPDKTALSTACGMLGLLSIPMWAFLRVHGIWERPR